MFTLEAIAKAVNGEHFGSLSTIQIGKVTSDSRDAKDSLFVAISGTKEDGHDYVNNALQNGALAIIATKKLSNISAPVIYVKDAHKALSRCADLFAGSPSRSLFTIGITGTNGKTTTNWIISHIFNSLDMPCLRVGTLGVGYPNGREQKGALTTPSPVNLHQTLKLGLSEGAKAAVLEVSSHSLSQARVDDISFDAGVFTNLTHDHLDYHKSMEEYFKAKTRLFNLLERSEKKTTACINIDDPYGEKLSALFGDKLNCLTFGENKNATVRIDDVTLSLDGVLFTLVWKGERYLIESALLGAYNVSNITAAFCASLAAGFDPFQISKTLTSLPDVPGRLERVSSKGITAFVDYAHTPDALSRALEALKPFVKGDLWVVFGCGGDRDRSKRPEMAEAAAKLADKVAVTSDNPRSESPEAIIEEILSGGLKPAITEVDRREAIRKVVSSANSGDVILVAGKGHEDYQILGSERIHFSDREEISNAFGKL